MADGKLIFDTKIDSAGFNQGTKTISKQAKSLNSSFMSLGKTIASVFAVKKLIDFGAEAISLGSDIQEVQNVVDTAFGSMAYKVEEFAKTSVDNFGISKLSAKQFASTYMAMGKGLGLPMEQASDMAIEATKRIGDIASFYNKTFSEVDTMMKSVWTGETESLKQIGVVMTETNLQAYALSQGITKSLSAMTQAEKVQLRYMYVMNQTSLAQGDFAKTSDSWANQTRILSERWKEFLSILGTGLIQVLTPVVQFLNLIMAKLISAVTLVANVLGRLFGKKDNGMVDVKDIEASAAAQEDFATSTEKAGKAAKGSLASFDEINNLSKDTADSSGEQSGSGSGVGFNMPDINPMIEDSDIEGVFDSKFESIVNEFSKYVNEMIKLFQNGFKNGLGEDFETSLQRAKVHLDNICKTVTEIFTDTKVTTSFDSWSKSFSEASGKILGSMVSIGQSIGENLISGVDKYLSKNKNFIADRISEMINTSTKAISKAGDLSVSFSRIFEVFKSDNAKQITSDLIELFANANLTIKELMTKLGSDIFSAFADPIINNQEKISLALENTIAPFAVVSSSICTGLTDTFAKVSETYDTYMAPMFEAFGNGLSNIIGTVLDAYNTSVAPVLDSLAGKFSEVWNNNIKPAIDGGIELVGKVCEALGVLWENVVAPFISWLIATIIPVLAPMFETIGKVTLDVFGIISGIILGLTKTLGGLIDFIIGVFTGDWKKAWSGIGNFFVGIIDTIKSVFGTLIGYFSDILGGIASIFRAVFGGIFNTIKGIINLILSAVEGLANGVVTGMNMVTGALNKLSFDVPDWVPILGGKKFGFNIPQLNKVSIPRLAKGGIADSPMIAQIGEYPGAKTNPEIVTPENLMRKIFREENGGNEEIVSTLKEILTAIRQGKVIAIDRTELAKIISKGQSESFRTSGKTLIPV